MPMQPLEVEGPPERPRPIGRTAIEKWSAALLAVCICVIALAGISRYLHSARAGRSETASTQQLNEAGQPSGITTSAPGPTDCTAKRTVARASQDIGQFIPSCDSSGNYLSLQCWGSTGYCWCARPNGTKFEGTDARGHPDATLCDRLNSPTAECFTTLCKLLNAPDTECLANQLALQAQQQQVAQIGIVGAFSAQCAADGSYEAMQCWGSTGQCWCADKVGDELIGTRVLPGTVALSVEDCARIRSTVCEAGMRICTPESQKEANCRLGFCYPA